MFTGRPSLTLSMKKARVNGAKERGLSEKSYFPDRMSKLGSGPTVDCRAANFDLEN